MRTKKDNERSMEMARGYNLPNTVAWGNILLVLQDLVDRLPDDGDGQMGPQTTATFHELQLKAAGFDQATVENWKNVSFVEAVRQNEERYARLMQTSGQLASARRELQDLKAAVERADSMAEIIDQLNRATSDYRGVL